MKNKLGSLKSMDCFVRGGGGGGWAFMVTRSIKARDRCRGNETMMKLWHLVKGGRTCGDDAEQTTRRSIYDSHAYI